MENHSFFEVCFFSLERGAQGVSISLKQLESKFPCNKHFKGRRRMMKRRDETGGYGWLDVSNSVRFYHEQGPALSLCNDGRTTGSNGIVQTIHSLYVCSFMYCQGVGFYCPHRANIAQSKLNLTPSITSDYAMWWCCSCHFPTA